MLLPRSERESEKRKKMCLMHASRAGLVAFLIKYSERETVARDGISALGAHVLDREASVIFLRAF